MHRRVITLILLGLLVVTAFGRYWEQDYWSEGIPDDPVGELANDNPGGFLASLNLAWWRMKLADDDNSIFPYAPDLNETDVFGNGLEDMAEVNCETTYFDGNQFIQVIGGSDSSGRPCFYYSKDHGYSWMKTFDPELNQKGEGTVLAVAQRPDTDELHLVANTADYTTVQIFSLDNLDDTSWVEDEEALIAGASGLSADMLFDGPGRGYLTISGIGFNQGKFWIWDGSIWWKNDTVFPGNDQLYDIWRMGPNNGSLFIAVDQDGAGADRCFFSDNDGIDWQEWSIDYFPGSQNYPQLVAFGSSADWTEKFVYLTSEGGGGPPEICRIDPNNPGAYSTINLNSTEILDIDDLTVSDDGIVFLSGIGVGGAGVWISIDDGVNWLAFYLEDPLSGLESVPVLFSDPLFGFLYLSGNFPTYDPVPFLVIMASRNAEIESLPYDCGDPSNFDHIAIDREPDPPRGTLKVFLRTGDNELMDGALDWSLCDEIIDYNDLDVKGVEQGAQFIQYKLVFTADNDEPLSFPAVDRFVLVYDNEGDPDPPRVLRTVPPDGAEGVPINALIRVFFDHQMDLDSFTDNFFILDGEDAVPWQGWLEGDGAEFVAAPDSDLPPIKRIDVLLDFGITDIDGYPIEDMNGDGYGAYDFAFTTGDNTDNEPPDVFDIDVTPNPTFGADLIALTAWADDTDNGGSLIAGGEYFLDISGQNGEGMPLAPADGDFDDTLEELLAVVDTSGWDEGSTYSLYVHAVDTAGNWSSPQLVTVETEGEYLDPARVYVWPNPATDTANFTFMVGGDSRVKLTVYDLAGRVVHRDSGEFVTGSPGSFVWDLNGVASDVYIFRIVAEETGGLGRYDLVIKKLAVVR